MVSKIFRFAKVRASALTLAALAAVAFGDPAALIAQKPQVDSNKVTRSPISPVTRASTHNPVKPAVTSVPTFSPTAKPSAPASKKRAPTKPAAKVQPEKAPQYPDPTKLTFEQLNWTVPLGQPYRDSLANGMRCYVAVDSQLPLIQINAYFKWGTLLDPPGKEGAGSLMAKLLRTGGTERYTPDSIDALIDRYAMNFRIAMTDDQLVVSASFLSEYRELGFNLLQQMLFSPRFDERKLDQEKKNIVEELSHQYENPGPAVDAAYQKLMYAGGPAARSITTESLKQIKRKDLIDLHRRAVGTVNCIIAVAGNSSRAAFIDRLERFPKVSLPGEIFFPDSPVKPNRKCLVVEKPISQVYVQFGVPLFKRPSPDYYAAQLASFILGGGGFTSRLGSKVRSDAGLTYHIHSTAESNYTFPGTWYIEFFTKSATFGQAMDLSLSVINEMRYNGVTAAELQDAQQTLIGSMPSSFRSPFDIVSTYAWNEYYGRSPYIFRDYPEALRAVTTQDVQRVIYAYFDPEICSYAVVGDTAALHKYGSHGSFDFSNLKPRKVVPADSLGKMK